MSDKIRMPEPEQALPGRSEAMPLINRHYVNGNPIKPPFPANVQPALFGMGCFWGAERLFWERPGVFSTAVGFAGGYTPNPTYEEVCTGLTAHNEVVLVVFDPAVIDYRQLLALFWEGHDPTQGMRQGPDIGTQYRSGIYTCNEQQLQAALVSRDRYRQCLARHGYGTITTEIIAAPAFYYAEQYHQQYLAKHPQRPSCILPVELTGRPRYDEK
ncbi:MAG: peptide-methionine (S)-S-oxide reductase MsrA [Gammaproteobacteria bacterium]